MLHLTFASPVPKPLRILCLGAHSDDIEIGAGGAVLTILDQYPGAHVQWVVFAAHEQRAREARESAAAFLAGAGQAEVSTHDFQDGFFPNQFAMLKKCFEETKARFRPDLIVSHIRQDHHQDHRLIADLTSNTFRDHLILGYEVIKYDPDLGNPNVFVPLSESVARMKVELLMRHFQSQRSRRWFMPETFMGMMRVRGVQSGAPSVLAEGFYASKLCL